MLLETLVRRGVALRVREGRVEWRPRTALTHSERKILESQHNVVAGLLSAAGEGQVTPGELPDANRERWTADPRPDLAADSQLWRDLLALAYERDGHVPDGLFGALHGLRCCGAGLVAIDSQIHLVAGEMGSEYSSHRERYLLPHKDTLIPLLRKLAVDRLA